MAISQAMCTSFKAELMLAVHDFRNATGDTFKLALYTSSATINANTTAYSATRFRQIRLPGISMSPR